MLQFLDQDTCLLASEQRHVLRAELEANKAGARVCRPALYQHTSPGERMLMTVGKFLDATVSQMPNRRRGVEAVLASIDSGVIPSRAMLLDRWVQHTSICADSRGAHRNIKAFAWAAAAVAATATAAALALVVSSLLGIGPSLGQRLFLEPILVANNSVPGLTCLKMGLACCAILATAVHAKLSELADQFVHGATVEKRQEDLANIPRVYRDNADRVVAA